MKEVRGLHLHLVPGSGLLAPKFKESRVRDLLGVASSRTAPISAAARIETHHNVDAADDAELRAQLRRRSRAAT